MRGRLATAVALTALLALVAGCDGGDDPTTAATAAPPTVTGMPVTTAPPATAPPPASPPATGLLPDLPAPADDGQARLPGASTVEDGLGGAPAIAPEVQRAAQAADCQVRAFESQGRNHLPADADFRYSTEPPTSGDHYAIWADWGVYEAPVPAPVQVHNLEHGGVIVHVGADVPAGLRREIGALWAASPPYMLVMPGAGASFPPAGVVVTSWQRWLVCRTSSAEALPAIEAFRDAYRGRGPEGAAGLNAPVPNDFPGMPEPVARDPGA